MDFWHLLALPSFYCPHHHRLHLSGVLVRAVLISKNFSLLFNLIFLLAILPPSNQSVLLYPTVIYLFSASLNLLLLTEA